MENIKVTFIKVIGGLYPKCKSKKVRQELKEMIYTLADGAREDIKNNENYSNYKSKRRGR